MRIAALAFFGKKKSDEPSPDDENNDSGSPPPPGEQPAAFSPEKAARFFEHAQTVHDATNYEYAMQSWLNGLRQDPTNLKGVEGFFRSAASFLSDPKAPKKGVSKDVVRGFSGRGDVDRYLLSLLSWGLKPREASLAVRATDSGRRLGLKEPTQWLAERAFKLVSDNNRPRKDLFKKLMEAFIHVDNFDWAVRSGEAAVRLDPTDGKLAAEVRDLSARATMSAGGYEDTDKEGGFRKNVRDLEKQQLLEHGDRVVKTENALDQLVDAAEQDYRRRPEDPPAINGYAKRLLERARPEDEDRAFKLLNKAFEDTKQFRFREMAGELKIRRARRSVLDLKNAAEANPLDEAAAAALAKGQNAFIKLEIDELKVRAEAYPTDLGIKFELGKRFFKLGQYEDAIEMFQEAQSDAKNRGGALAGLAESFLKIGWNDEAVQTFRRALEKHNDPTGPTSMDVRYGLMAALQCKAAADRELESAVEAEKIASSIAVQQINFKDIRVQRDGLKKLITELKGDA